MYKDRRLPRRLRTGAVQLENPADHLHPLPQAEVTGSKQTLPERQPRETHASRSGPQDNSDVCVPLRSTHTRARRVLGHRVPQLRARAQRTRPRQRSGRLPRRDEQGDDSAHGSHVISGSVILLHPSWPAGMAGAPAAYTWPMAVDLSCQ